MTDSVRWRPPLPSFGKLGGAPVILAHTRASLLDKLKEYYTERRSVGDLFEVRMPPGFLRRLGFVDQTPRYLSEYTASEQVHLLLKGLYFKASTNFKLKLRILLQKRNGLSRVRQWYHTANGIVLPYLISGGSSWEIIDSLTRFSLENCANNYAQFTRDMKSLKKAIRKAYALGRKPRVPRHLRTYWTAMRSSSSKNMDPHEWASYVLLWTQTRASGLADQTMIRLSVDKFCATVTSESTVIRMNPQVLAETCRGALSVKGENARISVGTTSCLEATRQEGGKTAFLKKMTRTRRLHRIFDFKDLSSEYIDSRTVRSSTDVVQWAVQTALERPAYVRTARLHCVAEPSKARTITVASYAYQVLMGVFAHVFQATLMSAGVRSGLTKDRHLWRFLTDTMNPQSTMWGHLRQDSPVFCLSTDLSEATDFGNRSVARQIWLALIKLAKVHEEFPVGLAVLAMNLYCGKRYICVPQGNKYKLITTTRGWFMGDMMTKVILTIAHDYSMRLSGIKVYSLVGDDEVALHNDRARLFLHLDTLISLGFRVSVEDTFVSTRLMFYCEEGAFVPQRPTDATHVNMRRARPLGYLDYPRIRLLLAESCETDNYSMTNIGRFSLLGKETRWVYSTNPVQLRRFETASLLQHVMVPQDSDTLCPFTPLEIGGDGSFTSDPTFLMKVIADKSRGKYRETLYRIDSIMNSQFAFRFVRSERLNEVVHKHHLMLPVLEAIRPYLPEKAVIEPQSDVHRNLLESVRVRGLERPQQTWLRLCRGFYYGSIFRGLEPLEPKFDLNKSFFGGGQEKDPDLNCFIKQWANPGFRFANHDPYFVLRSEVEVIDPLHLPWSWKTLDALKYPSAFEMYSQWMTEEVLLEDKSLSDVIELIVRNRPLPDRVVKRLNLFMESDNYVISQLPSEFDGTAFFLVSNDLKLAARIQYLLTQRSTRFAEVWVYAMDPMVYLVGGLSNGRGYHSSHVPEVDYFEATWVEDPGSVLHCDYTCFTDGFPHDETVYDKRYNVYRTTHQCVAGIKFTNPAHVQEHLT